MKKLLSIAFIVVAVVAFTGVSVHLASAVGFTQCSDGFNNDPAQDSLIDAADPGCHVGGTLSGAYDSSLNSEFNTNSGTGTGSSSAQCSDGTDNDGDGKVDATDPDCHTDLNANNSSSYNRNDNSEFGSCITGSCNNNPVVYQCNDGIDNDSDGFVDYPSDPGCSSYTDNTEYNQVTITYQCNDGYDNDSDGRVDYPSDPGCSSYTDNSEYDQVSYTYQCNDGYDNDGDGRVDYPSDPGCSSYTDNSEYDQVNYTYQCNDGYDNDGDGRVDYPNDPGCYSYTDNSEYDQTNTQNLPPYFISFAGSSASVNQLYVYDANALDPENNVLTYNLISGPAGLTINPTTGLVQWIPQSYQAGSTYTVIISVTDGFNSPVNQTFTIRVNSTYVPPVIPVDDLRFVSVVIQNDGQNPVITTSTGIQTVSTNACGCPVNSQVITTGYNNCGTTVANYAGVLGANVVVTFETNKPSRGHVVYSLVSGGSEYRTPDDGVISTVHRVNLGQLEVGRTYYIRAVATAGGETARSNERVFSQLVGVNQVQQYPVQQNTTNGNNFGSAGALASIGTLLFSPWFLLIVIILLLLLIFFRRRRETVAIAPLEVTSSSHGGHH